MLIGLSQITFFRSSTFLNLFSYTRSVVRVLHRVRSTWSAVRSLQSCFILTDLFTRKKREKNIIVQANEQIRVKKSGVKAQTIVKTNLKYCVYQNDFLLKQKSIPGFRCTATLVLVLFVPIVFVAMHSYKPLSAGINFLMISVPLFTSLLPAGKAGIPTLLQFITGRGKPSAWQTA